MDGKIFAEWEPLKKVYIHRPGIEMFFGLLNPTGSLYERAFSRNQARQEHEILENALKNEFGVEVYRLKEKILHEVDKNPHLRDKLIELAKETLSMHGNPTGIKSILRRIDKDAKYLDSAFFFDILILNPSFDISSSGDKVYNMNYKHHQPLCNLYFMRDQQFMTDKGIVLCNLHSPVRRKETRVTKFLWEEVLKIPIFHEIEAPGTIEGGEFIPMGNFAMVGIGSRTNRHAINQLLKLPFGYHEIAVVHQPMHPLMPKKQPDPMIDMHLDTYFNIAGKEHVVGCEVLLKEAKVEIYHKESRGYKKDPKMVTLYEYIQMKKLNLISLTTLEQMAYASNFLCIKDKKILAIEIEQNISGVMEALERKAKLQPARYGKLLGQVKKDYQMLKKNASFFPHKKELASVKIDAYPLILRNLTGGFGGAHCMTCSLARG